jgi:hypothetical protein
MCQKGGWFQARDPRLAQASIERRSQATSLAVGLKSINTWVSIGVSILRQFGGQSGFLPFGFMDLAQMTERFPPSPPIKTSPD